MAKLVSRTYGEALFEVAEEAGEAKAAELLEEIETVEKIQAQNPKFDELMKHPGISKPEKLAIIRKVFQGNVSKEREGFFEVVVSKDRYRDLPAIFSYFTEKVKEKQKIGVAYVTTAIRLTPEQEKAVEGKLLATGGYRKMEMHFSVDTAIIGGMIIRIGDRVVDSSIRTKLDDLTKQLLKIQLG